MWAIPLPEPADPLWQRIAAHPIGLPDATLTFAARLARENRWTPTYTQRVIEEYRRFCYLAITAGHEVTPSDQVDQAWHLHLTYSRDYWEVFCPLVLGHPLHHGPTAGGAQEGERFGHQYAATLASYEAAFGPVPDDVWSPAADRFLIHPRAFRMLPGQVLLWRHQLWLLAVAALVLGLVLVGIGWLGGRNW